MMFLDNSFLNNPALVDAESGRSWTYAQLSDLVQETAKLLAHPRKALVFCFAQNDISSVVGYLAALKAGHAVCLLDAQAREPLKRGLIDAYDPDFIVEPSAAGQPGVARRQARRASPIHPDLSLLLSTSGTTGSAKLVRLSRKAVETNARAIAEYLGLAPGERGLASLPLHYSFGLSILNSHLAAGACVVLTRESLSRPELWKAAAERGCTSLAGVPYSFEIMRRIGFEKICPDSVRTLLQAGGRLSEELVVWFDAEIKRRGGRLFVMYGQTEASPRMSYVPPERLPAKAGSVGVAIPGGRISIEDGEIVYRGPNVMMGYAERADDLSKGDELRGELRTGDLGRFDEDGFLYITGRAKRFSKIYGLRLNLDEIEARLKAHGPAAVVGDDEKIVAFCEFGGEELYGRLRRELAQAYQINHAAFELRKIEALPLTGNGKIDYDKLPHGPGRDPQAAAV